MKSGFNNQAEVVFEVAAGKYDLDEINWKYIDTFTDFELAKKAFSTVRDYTIQEFKCYVILGDQRLAIDLCDIGLAVDLEPKIDDIWRHGRRLK